MNANWEQIVNHGWIPMNTDDKEVECGSFEVLGGSGGARSQKSGVRRWTKMNESSRGIPTHPLPPPTFVEGGDVCWGTVPRVAPKRRGATAGLRCCNLVEVVESSRAARGNKPGQSGAHGTKRSLEPISGRRRGEEFETEWNPSLPRWTMFSSLPWGRGVG